MNNMYLVVSVDAAWGIGYKGQLLAKEKKDMQRFRELTLDKTIVYGWNTLKTFPECRPLPGRKNLILTPDEEVRVQGAEILHSIDEVLEYVNSHPEEQVVVVGGASVYHQLLPYCTKAYVTKFDETLTADVFFEDLDASDEWRLAEKMGKIQGSSVTMTFCTYCRT